MERVQEKEKTFFDAAKDSFHYTNRLQAPGVEKVVVATGIGRITDKNKIQVIEDRLAKITGQKAVPRGAKKSIASFKTRAGDSIGYQVTLRGGRMYDFLNKLIHVALPRTRDFRGLPATSFDEMGNYTIGIREHSIFPEASDEELKDIFGLAVTIVTTAKTKKEAREFLEHLGFPIQKEEQSET